VSIEQVRRAWNQLIAPKVRFVPLDARTVDDHALRRFNASTRQTCAPLR
jgi:hypothetical protein